MDIRNIFLLVASIIDFCLGILIFFRGDKKAISLSYAAVCFFVTFWALSLSMFGHISDLYLDLWLMKFSYLAAAGIGSSLLCFALLFPDAKSISSRVKFLIFVPTLIIFILLLTSVFLVKQVFIQPWGKDVILGNWGKIIFAIYFIIFFVGATIIILNKHRLALGRNRIQLLYIFLGISVPGTFGVFFNLFLPFIGNHKFIWLGPLFPIFMVGAIGYAIVVHRLMDIKVIMRRYSVYLASLSSIILSAIGLKYVFDRYIPLYTDWADFFILIGGVSVFPEIKGRFYRLANKYFFSSLYDARQVIAELSDKLRSTLDVENIYDHITKILTNAFHVKALGILIYNEKGSEYLVAHNSGFKLNGNKSFANNRELHRLFIAKNEPIILDELKESMKPDYKDTVDLLLKLKVAVLMPLNIKDKTIGLIALGQKESGDMYNDEDLQVMKVAGAQAAIAMENALLYDESKKFGSKLEKEVEKATRDLRKANVQLKKLDQAKSDFISIASHQLRTPLTVIKGYISMILEGDFGALTEPEHESLEKIYESNERLINLVENLLNISRIESGRLKFDFKQVDLDQMAASVAEELSGNAKKKNLLLQYQPPAEPLPKLKLDEEKIRQVVMNLVDNAIKYTEQGNVTVKLEQQDNKVRFCVADSGMGIKTEDMGNLFKKFSRGDGTNLVHTEGTGLGLYVARMMIEAHQGRIWAESDGVGEGSRFCFELPVK